MQGTFGDRLQEARKRAGYKTQESLGDAVGVSGKTIRNWETGKHTPDYGMRAKLRERLGDFDSEGDPVEIAIRRSDLAPFRQTRVIAAYQEQVYEQRRESRAG